MFIIYDKIKKQNKNNTKRQVLPTLKSSYKNENIYKLSDPFQKENLQFMKEFGWKQKKKRIKQAALAKRVDLMF